MTSPRHLIAMHIWKRSRPRVGLLREFCYYLMDNKKWWLLPIVLMLGALGVLFFLATVGGGAIAPFIYPIF